MFSPTRPPCRHGFTLIELAIVLGVVGTIIGAIWLAANSVTQQRRVGDAVEDLKEISTNIRSMYSAAQVFPTSGDVTTTLMGANFNIFPTTMIAAGASNPLDPDGGNVNVIFQPNSVPTQFEIQFNEPSGGTSPSCAALLTIIWGVSADLNIVSVSGDGSTWKTPTSASVNLGTFTGCTQTAIIFNK